VKNFAKLALLFSISFLIIFFASAGFRFLALRVEWAKNFPVKPETALSLLISAAHWALSLSLFAVILFSLCYAGRKSYSAVMTVFTVMGLSFFFCTCISIALNNWNSVPPAQSTGVILGNRGLILSNSLNRNETSVVLLNGTSDPFGPRVIAIPGQPLIFHEASGGAFDLPPIPFGDDTPWFLRSLAIDLRLNAGMLHNKFNDGFIGFSLYACSLIFLLCSLGYAIKFSVWPFANLCLGVLAFRGILTLEVFLSSPEMQDILDSFLRGIIPAAFIIPLVYLLLGSLLHLYSGLVSITRRRDDDDL